LEREACIVFRNAAAERFTRRFYPPPPWKVNAVVMFWKASKAECCESGDEHFGVGRKTIDYTTITAPYASIRKA
jgi:hypothetical protein